MMKGDRGHSAIHVEDECYYYFLSTLCTLKLALKL